MDYMIREVRPEDLKQVAAVEQKCFPKAEAASEESLKVRIAVFPESFFVAEYGGRIIGFINGCSTDSRVIQDEMFEDTGLHHADGAYQSIFGLDVVPEYRKQGVAASLMKHMVEISRRRGKKGLILTCKNHLIPYYEKFGYRNAGLSRSAHGGAVWYDMILEF